MQFCQDHWNKLREAIKVRDLWSFVAKSSEDLFNRYIKEEKEELTIPDPLITAHNLILSRVVEKSPYILFQKEDGSHWCPLCDVRDKEGYKGKNKGTLDINWIDGCCDDIKEHYIKEGWLKSN